MLEEMDKEEQDPDIYTFVGVLNVCSHTGAIHEGFLYFETMHEVYGINADLEHLTCIVDLLSRAGQLNKAMAAMQWMPCHPNLATCHTLLSACRREGHLELGLYMFAHAVELDQGNAGTYLTLMSMYADIDFEGSQFSHKAEE
ncbi:hypothetical protein L7F22_062758 [Adiantum nelumboides]|nr:hypothetical protein [Adiantum nelumboides]